ncbi:MAG: efflux RND transporter permease subunit [Luteibaculum sp.]
MRTLGKSKLESLFKRNFARKVLIVCGLILTAALVNLKNLSLNYDFEQFFPQDDPELDFYLKFRDQFGTDNDFLLVSFQPKVGIFNEEFLQQLDSLEGRLKMNDKVLSTRSPLSLKIPVIGPLGVFQSGLLNPPVSEEDSLRIVQDPMLDEKFISSSRQSMALLIEHEPFLSKVKSDSLLHSITRELDKLPNTDYKMAGKIYGQNYFIKKMASELAFFAATSIILLIIFLYFSFREAWAVWLPLVVVVATVVLNLSLITLFGYSISVLTTILPTILFVVGISDVVHLTEKYIQELRAGKSKKVALVAAYKQIGLATLLTSVTTCIGFLTLLTSSIMPIADFGWFAALGVILAFLLAFSLFPSALLLLPRPKKLIQSKGNKAFWNGILGGAFVFSLRNQKALGLGFLVLVLASLYGISNIEINNYLLEDLSKNDPHRQEFEHFEEEYGGVRPFEMAVKLGSNELLDWQTIKSLEKMHSYLGQNYGVNNMVSPMQAVYMANRAKHGGLAEYYRFPESESEYEEIKPMLSKALKHPMVKKLYQPDSGEMRISGNVIDLGGAIFREKNKALESYMEKLAQDSGIEFQQTGMAMLIDKNNESLSIDMLLGLLIAFCAVGLIMGMLYKSFKMVLVALIPNIIPLLLIGGFMALFGIDLKLSTAIIFTIAFGIAVDDTIHFLARYKLEISAGKKPLTALKNTYLGAGKAIVVTSIILFSGFITLVFSSFSSTFYLGLLVSLTLVFAVVTDLLLLPGLLRLAYEKSKARAES